MDGKKNHAKNIFASSSAGDDYSILIIKHSRSSTVLK